MSRVGMYLYLADTNISCYSMGVARYFRELIRQQHFARTPYINSVVLYRAD